MRLWYFKPRPLPDHCHSAQLVASRTPRPHAVCSKSGNWPRTLTFQLVTCTRKKATGNFRKVATSLIDKLPHTDATRTFVLQQVCMLAELRMSARVPHCFRRARIGLDLFYSISAFLCFTLSAPHRPVQNALRRLFTASLWIAVCFPRTRQGPVCFPLHDRSSLARTRARIHTLFLFGMLHQCMLCRTRQIRLRDCTRRKKSYRAWQVSSSMMSYRG